MLGREAPTGRTRARLITAALIGLAVVMLGVKTGPAEARTPLPRRDFGRSVYDLANVITAEHAARMEAMHTDLRRSTGVAIVVIAVPALEGETIAELAVRVATAWGVGEQGEDRGIVLALARDDREIFIATGYGVEGYLPDGKVGAILDRQALPRLRQGDFSTAVYQTSVALVAASAEEYGVRVSGVEAPREREPQGRQWSWIWAAVSGVLLLYLLVRHPRVLLFVLWSGDGRGGSGGGGFGGGRGFGGFGGGGFGGGGAGRRF